MTGPYYLLGDPWIHPSERGKTTAILYGGGGDPHVAVQVANTSCLMDCHRCEKDPLAHRKDAEYLVKTLNRAVARNVGSAAPPFSIKEAKHG